MSSYRRYATRRDAAERAMRQVLRHRMETYAEPFPDGSMYVQPVGVDALVRGMESIRASLENWPVPPPPFQSQTPAPAHDVMRCRVESGHVVMMDGRCALCSYVDPSSDHDVAGCTGVWKQYGSGRRKCSDCGGEMNLGPKPEPKVVGYRSKRESVMGDIPILRCLDHPLPEGYGIPVTSEDLENGGVCTWCGNDLLAHPGANQ